MGGKRGVGSSSEGREKADGDQEKKKKKLPKSGQKIISASPIQSQGWLRSTAVPLHHGNVSCLSEVPGYKV
jgi:hypothetical protein